MIAAGALAPGAAADPPLLGERLGHVPVLDGVRGLAILLVFAVHFRWPATGTLLDRLVGEVTRAGWIGVDLFFVLSGFLITSILLDTKARPAYFRNFYVRRVLRLFPVYYALLALLFVLLPRVLSPVPAELATLAPHQGWYWVYAVNVFQVMTHPSLSYFNTLHLWSLSVEEQFYLFWPLVVWLTSPRALLRTCLAAVVLALGFRLLATGWNAWAAYVLTPSRMDALALGGAIAVLARDGRGSALLRRWWRPVAAASLLGILAIALWRHGYREDDPLVLTGGYLLDALAGGALLAGLIAQPLAPRFRPFHWRWLQWTGKVSYGAYVYHLPLLLVVARVKDAFRALPPVLGSQLPAQVTWMACMSAGTLGLAALSYRGFELPFLRLKEFFGGVDRRGAA